MTLFAVIGALLTAAGARDAAAGIPRSLRWLYEAKIEPDQYASARAVLARRLRGCAKLDCSSVIARRLPARTEAIAFAREYWGLDDPQFAMFLVHLAKQSTDGTQREEMLEFALQIFERRDPDHPMMGVALYQLAVLRRPQPRFFLADFFRTIVGPMPRPGERDPEKIYLDTRWIDRAAAFWNRRATVADVDLAEIAVIRADFDMAQLRFEQAIANYRYALDQRMRKAKRIRTVQQEAALWANRAKLIEALLGVSDLDGALEVSVSSRSRSAGAGAERLEAESARAEALVRKRRFAEAEVLLRSIIEEKERVQSFGKYRDITALAEILVERGALAEADLILRLGQTDIAAEKPGSDEFHRLTAYRGARIYLSRGQRAKAKEWLDRAGNTPGYLPWHFGGGVRGIAMLARFHREDGTRDSIASLRSLLADIDRTPYADNPDTGDLVTELGQQFRTRGDVAQARQLLARARRIWTAAYPEGAERRIDGDANLADLLAGPAAEHDAARSLYRIAGDGVLARVATYSDFGREAQQTLIRYRPIFTAQVRLAWQLGDASGK
ncbi:hypothetical protein [Sphingomonas sp.]|uniref:tetratricopeptide repeat protein n=1 Tax=Sphingomonas sp. TaxID=28214 RepID=UPI001EB6D65B|nr:hypothetical protein [Sphingomonas sp.]MBX3595344.1 hypothetical protein [Sphingomonas sp.]